MHSYSRRFLTLKVATFWCATAVLADTSATANPGGPEALSAPTGLVIPGASLPALAAKVNQADYRLAARDLVSFQIFEETDTNTIQRVSASGEINVPLLGTVQIGGLTLREAEQKLARAYVDGGFFIKPQIILSVQAYAPRSISILGQVNKPEQIEFPVERDLLGIIQAITLAGGFTRVAKIDEVRVLRTSGGKEQQFTINIAAYLDQKQGAEFKLQPDDIVYVPERVF